MKEETKKEALKLIRKIEKELESLKISLLTEK